MKNTQRHFRFGASLLIVGAMLVVWNRLAIAQPLSNGYPNSDLLVTAQQVASHLRDRSRRVVDVRSWEQYIAGHIPGAVNLPMAAITQDRNGTPGMLSPLTAVSQALGERGIARESRVVIYDDVGGDKATRLFWVLDYLGHPQVSVLQGGFRQWQQEEGSVSQKVPPNRLVTYQAAPDDSRLATLPWVVSRLEDSDVVLLDARSDSEFVGRVPGDQVHRPGRIPGAVNVDWRQNLTATSQQFRSGAELKRLYEGVGVTSDKEIVVYCRTGMRASHDYFVLRLLGYPRVRLYDGSYVEWAADEAVPVASGKTTLK